MAFKTDIEIAQETTMQHITEVAKTAGVDPKYLEQYGNYKAKVDYNILTDYNASTYLFQLLDNTNQDIDLQLQTQLILVSYFAIDLKYILSYG